MGSPVLGTCLGHRAQCHRAQLGAREPLRSRAGEAARWKISMLVFGGRSSWLLVQEHPRCESSVSSVPLGAALRGSQCWAQHSPVLQQGRVARLGSPHGLALSLHSLCCQLNQGIPF